MDDLCRFAARMVGIGFDGLSLPTEARATIRRGVRNGILFSRNVESPSQLAELTFETKSAAGDDPLMISVDQEGGRVLRLREPFTPIPSMRQVGRVGDEQLAYQVGQILARELRAVNIDMNLAPVCDVDTNPGNPVISSRSFGAEPESVSQLACAVMRGLQDSGVAACAKHFPGHGDTSNDSHQGLPLLPLHDLARLQEIELPPFEAVIRGGVAAVMSAHVIYNLIDPVYPGTLSRPILDDLLRKRLRFQGLVMSDDMEMKAIADHYGFDEAIVRAANAGVDLFWICHSDELQNRAIDALIRAAESGELTRQRLEESSQRIDCVFARFVQPGSPKPQTAVIGAAEHQALAEQIKRRAGDVVLDADPTERFACQQRV